MARRQYVARGQYRARRRYIARDFGDIAQRFRNNRQLQQFQLSDVTPTGRVLGTGSFGSVEEVIYQHLVCAGKKLHEALIEDGNEGVLNVVCKYEQECQLMASLRHPNITQFLGLCYLPETRFPVLVMERLEISLEDVLQFMPNIPFTLKCSILENVANGLVYLHKREFPVIHRDLTARNVLLTSSLVAKITDMGNSRIIDMNPGQMARTLSRMPGTLDYMPPEALKDTCHYGPSLDIFSFGHLSLYTMTQEYPKNLLSGTYPDPNNPEKILGCSEVARRGEYIEQLRAKFSQFHPALVQLIEQCLHNTPEQRPATDRVLNILQRLRKEVEDMYGSGSMIKVDIREILLMKDITKKDKRIEELMERCQELEASQERAKADIEILETQLQSLQREKDRQLQQHQTIMELKDKQLQQQQKVIEEKNSQLQQHQTTMKLKDIQLVQQQTIIKENKRQLQQQQTAMKEKDRQLQQQLTAMEEKDRQLQQQKTAKEENDRHFHQLQTTMDRELRQQQTAMKTKNKQLHQQQKAMEEKDKQFQQLQKTIEASRQILQQLEKTMDFQAIQAKKEKNLGLPEQEQIEEDSILASQIESTDLHREVSQQYSSVTNPQGWGEEFYHIGTTHYQLFISGVKSYSIIIYKDATIYELFQLVEQKTLIPPFGARLNHAGKILRRGGGLTLSDYPCIQNNSTLFLN